MLGSRVGPLEPIFGGKPAGKLDKLLGRVKSSLELNFIDLSEVFEGSNDSGNRGLRNSEWYFSCD